MRLTIREYLISMNMVLLCLLIPAQGALFLWSTSQFRDAQLNDKITLMREDLKNRSSSLLYTMGLSAEQAVAGFDYSFLQNLVMGVIANDPDIVSCMITDHPLTVVAHDQPEQLGARLELEDTAKVIPFHAEDFPAERPEGKPPIRLVWPEKGSRIKTLQAVMPIYSGSELWGFILCQFSLESLDKAIAKARQEWDGQMDTIILSSLATLAVFLLIGLVIAYFLTRSFVRAIRVLSEGVQQVASGDLDEAVAAGTIRCREFADLATSFNQMTDSLRYNRKQLNEYSRFLEDKVVERTQELQEAQESLLKQAHEAGMAEMAVGVLHNIGNAITPAKVGSSVLIRQLKESPLKIKLGEALTPLHRYLVEGNEMPPDQKEHFCRIIELLPDSISEEFDHIIQELGGIREKHEHIESIINLQMRYARLLGTSDLVDITQVARDALKMLADSLSRRKVEVITDFTNVLPVQLEEAKLLQILVNLIKNSYEAMEGVVSGERRLHISSFLENEKTVRLTVSDNGSGFTEEERKKLFSFGYSTKERGSGFGLHSCANYLIANNGSIEAESKGQGQGARFTIRIPGVKEENERRFKGNGV